MAEKYSLIFDDDTKTDLKALNKASKKTKDDVRAILNRIETMPKCFKQLVGPLKGFRKAKAKGNYRVVYSTDDHDRRAFILAIGDRDHVYNMALNRLNQKRLESEP